MNQTDNKLLMPPDALLRAVEINRDTPHTFFLGAGTSLSAGIPDAETCIWQWKRDVYRSNHPGENGRLRDESLPQTRQTIQQWLDSDGDYPKSGTCAEYGFFAEYCYPIAADRRQYFQRLTEQGEPTVGHHLLCLLAEADIVRAVWTTNFDDLLLRTAATSHVTPVEVNLDAVQRVNRPPRRGELLYVALHGEYRYDALKNTPEEIRKQDQVLLDALSEQLKTHSLIVSGYSGRDACILNTLKTAYSQPGTGRLYWCGYRDETPSTRIQELLETARSHGRMAYYISTQGFDDLLVRLTLHCLSGELLERAQRMLGVEEDRGELPGR